MNIYDKLLELTDSDTIQLAGEFRNSIGKELVLGQTDFMCRYGTLSAGHEKLTDSQRYYQAIKEMHTLASNMRNMRAQAMINQAKINSISSKIKIAKILKFFGFGSMFLRLHGELAIAQENLFSNLVTVEDQTRMLNSYNNVRLELKESVEAQYPLGIEQAERDNWEAVMRHRIIQRKAGFPERLTHVPMDKESAFKIGLETSSLDMMSWMMVSDQKKASELSEKHVKELNQQQRIGLVTN